jgi:hypothetical protein
MKELRKTKGLPKQALAFIAKKWWAITDLNR